MRFVIKDGTMTVFCISTTEDLWHDYLYFKVQANALNTPTNEILRLRYLRAAVSAFYAYVEGVVNEWCTKLKTDEGEKPEAIDDFLWNCLEKKCKYVTECVSKGGTPLSNPIVWSVKKNVRKRTAIRNRAATMSSLARYRTGLLKQLRQPWWNG
jgi:hypothetical protein